MASLAETVGATLRQRLASIVEFLALLYTTSKAIVKLRFQGFRVIGHIIVNQLRFTGVHAIGPVSVASLAIGGLVMIQGSTYVPADYVLRVTTAILVKEVVPLLTALILIGRSGTAISIEIGNMKLNEEIAAIKKMGIPIEHLVFAPRLIGMVVSFLALVIYADFSALVGGFYLARWANVTPISFRLDELLAGVQMSDFFSASFKVLLFGVVIAVTSIQYGLRVRRSVREVPIVTTTAVVRSMIACLILNTFISTFW